MVHIPYPAPDPPPNLHTLFFCPKKKKAGEEAIYGVPVADGGMVSSLFFCFFPFNIVGILHVFDLRSVSWVVRCCMGLILNA